MRQATARRRAVAGAVLLGLGFAGSAGPPTAAYADHHRQHRLAFVIKSARITESSSLVVSATHPGLAYTANDSGDGATIYVLETSGGTVVGSADLAGVTPVDPEAMASCGDGSLLFADIGDNSADRPDVAIYRLPEPGRGRSEVSVDKLTLAYVDGPHDAESVLCDRASGRVFVVTKQAVGAAVYVTARDSFGRKRALLRPVAAAPGLSTDATLLPGGRAAVIRTYVGAALYEFPSWRLLRSFPLPPQRQGESIAAPPRGHIVWIGSEGSGSAVLAVALPRSPLPTGPASPTAAGSPPATTVPGATPRPPAASPSVAAESGDSGTAAKAWAGLAGVALVVALLAVWVVRRRPH